MKTNKTFLIVLSSSLLVFFLIALNCYAFFQSEDLIYNLFLAQLIVFSLAACSILVHSIVLMFRKVQSPIPVISKIVVLTETNVPLNEFSLHDKSSMLVGKSDTIYFRLEGDLSSDEYALLNRVESNWYIERLSSELSVSLKRAGEQYIYKLKPKMFYKLQVNDVVFIGNERLLLA